MQNEGGKIAAEPKVISEAMFRSIIDASPVPMVLNDDQQNITYLNPAFIKTFGYTLTDIPTLADWWLKAYPDPAYRDWAVNTWKSKIEATKRTGSPIAPLEVSIVCRGGSDKSVHASAAALGDPFTGEQLVILYDITDRKQAESALNARFQLLFEGANDAIFLADAQTGLLIDCNEAAENLLGRDRTEIIGQPQTFLHPPEAAQDIQEKFRAHASQSLITHVETEVLRKDGKKVVVSIAPSVTTIGNQKVIQGIFRDITERKKVEQALQMMRFCVDHAGDSILWVSRDGEILYVNDAACRDRHYSPGELVGMTIFDLDVEPDYQPGRWEAHFEDLRCRGAITLETRHRTKDGHIFPVEVNANYVHIGDKEFIFAFARDISERKRIVAALQSSRQRLAAMSRQLITIQEKERRHLARELHDEIGQILTAIKMNLRRSERNVTDGVKANQDENVALVDQAIVLVRNLAINLRPAQLDELGLVAALHWLVKHQASIGNFAESLDVDLCDTDIPTEIQTVCFRIAQEALTNAVRHAKPGRVSVKLWVADDKVYLTVHDDGVGFDVNDSIRRVMAGSSFGLVSMQERASLVGGQAKIESTPGQGTTIHLYCPLSQP